MPLQSRKAYRKRQPADVQTARLDSSSNPLMGGTALGPCRSPTGDRCPLGKLTNVLGQSQSTFGPGPQGGPFRCRILMPGPEMASDIQRV